MTPETALRTIPDADLRLECCACGHEALLPVHIVTSQLGIAATLGDLQARIRCRQCGEGNPIIVIPAQAPDSPSDEIAEQRATTRRTAGHG